MFLLVPNRFQLDLNYLVWPSLGWSVCFTLLSGGPLIECFKLVSSTRICLDFSLTGKIIMSGQSTVNEQNSSNDGMRQLWVKVISEQDGKI